MVHRVALGIGEGLDAKECARLAAQNALNMLGSAKPSLAISFASQEFDISQVLNGLNGILGTIPTWGLSTFFPFTQKGEQPYSVIIGLISGQNLKVRLGFWQPLGNVSQDTVHQFNESIQNEIGEISAALIAADCMSSNIQSVSSSLSTYEFPIVGGVIAGASRGSKSSLIAGNQGGADAPASVFLKGKFRLGYGIGHGWKPTGLNFKVTRARDFWIQTLDGIPAAEAYSKIFGYSQKEWALPPLNNLVRLYPLGFNTSPSSKERILRSVLNIETDGSFRMNAPVIEGETASLMVGDPQACQEEARMAVEQALQSLNKARPILAIAFIDIAWKFLFENAPQVVIETIVASLPEIPLMGAYTVGQISRPGKMMSLQHFNQAILVAILGEAQD